MLCARARTWARAGNGGASVSACPSLGAAGGCHTSFLSCISLRRDFRVDHAPHELLPRNRSSRTHAAYAPRPHRPFAARGSLVEPGRSPLKPYT